jgi:hypothetical protein
MLIAVKIDILSISRRIGHAKASMTLDVYGHLMPPSAAAAAIEGLFRKRRAPPTRRPAIRRQFFV